MKKMTNRLRLNREAIRVLGAHDIRKVVGGAVADCTNDCGQTHNVSICECISYQLSCR